MTTSNADYGLFDVKIDVPQDVTVGAVGEPQGEPVVLAHSIAAWRDLSGVWRGLRGLGPFIWLASAGSLALLLAAAAVLQQHPPLRNLPARND